MNDLKDNNELALPDNDYSLEVIPYEDDPSALLIPISNELTTELSVLTSNIPTLVANETALEALHQTAYSITFNGRPVSPSELWQKKNGSFISNLKGENGKWGKQTDVNAIDNTAAQGVTLASSVFAVAAMATSMYYMKSINDKLASLHETMRSVESFLENDKQSQVEADFAILQDIAWNMDSIKSNDDLKQVKLHQFSELQRSAKSNTLFYEKQLYGALTKYKNSKNKKETGYFKDLKKNYFYYRFCLVEYSLSKLIEIQLTDSFEKEQLEAAKKDILTLSKRHNNLNNKLYNELRNHEYRSLESKAMRTLSNSLYHMSNFVSATPLKKTDLNDSLRRKGKQTKNKVQYKAKKKVNQVITHKDYKLIDPIVDEISTLEKIYHEPLKVIKKDNGKYYLHVVA